VLVSPARCVVQDDIRNPADLDAWLAAHG